jgi:hypothetical protein
MRIGRPAVRQDDRLPAGWPNLFVSDLERRGANDVHRGFSCRRQLRRAILMTRGAGLVSHFRQQTPSATRLIRTDPNPAPGGAAGRRLRPSAELLIDASEPCAVRDL